MLHYASRSVGHTDVGAVLSGTAAVQKIHSGGITPVSRSADLCRVAVGPGAVPPLPGVRFSRPNDGKDSHYQTKEAARADPSVTFTGPYQGHFRFEFSRSGLYSLRPRQVKDPEPNAKSCYYFQFGGIDMPPSHRTILV